MDWDKDLSNNAKIWMHMLGEFSPTCDPDKKTVKGYMYDNQGGGKVYFDSGELKELSAACIEVADWLVRRSESLKSAPDLQRTLSGQ